MGDVVISGNLVLSGNLVCNDGDIDITVTGTVTPVPDPDTMKTFYSHRTNSYTTANGQGRTMTATIGDIIVDGLIDGVGGGFPAESGPGSNSSQRNIFDDPIPGYGGTHAGLGYVKIDPGLVLYVTDYFTMTPDNISFGRMKLSARPIEPEAVMVNIVSGGAQVYGLDFTIDVAHLDWNGTPLQSLLDNGDVLRVVYIGDTTPLAPSSKPRYGHWETPVSLGSGGGYYLSPSWYLGENTYGGGAIKLEAPSGTVRVYGTINMDGQEGNQTGGGAGGSIWIVGWDLIGTGKISAAGGWTRLPINSGGGGGGYISLWYYQNNNFTGEISVDGGTNRITMDKGAGDGKIYIKAVEPYLEEKFTGHYLNPKWWGTENSVTLDNVAILGSPGENFDYPAVQSRFSVSGEDIMASADYIPQGNFTGHADFMLYADNRNWVGMSLRPQGIFGISSVDGYLSASGIPFDHTDVSFRIVKRDSTFNFQYYDSTSTPQTLYTDVLPELESLSFGIRLAAYKSPAETFRTESLRLTPLDISRQYLQMDGTPADATAVAVNVVKGSPQYFGSDFYVTQDRVRWDTSGPDTTRTIAFSSLLAVGDVLRVMYEWSPPPHNDSTSAFDNVAIYQGVIDGAETSEPVIYVDSDFGSDSSEGRQLSPLKNLFVATAWAKRGGTVVLYDGTYNPTEVLRKDLTIRGAEGTKPIITSANVLDTTGSGWETNALSFFGCQGIVDNVEITDSDLGVSVENGNFDISRTEIHDVYDGIRFIKCDPRVARNKIHDVIGTAMDFTACVNPEIYSNVVYATSAGLRFENSHDATIASNTFDSNDTHVVFDQHSSGVVASNNLTNGNMGLLMSLDSSVASYRNNYYSLYGTPYSRTPDATGGDMSTDPLYYFPVGNDYHLELGSPNIGAGDSTRDSYLIDFDGARRIDTSGVLHMDIGAFEYIDASHPAGDYYVASAGDDFWGNGTMGQPYQTVDKAMLVADATMHIDAGHYDTFYLNLNRNFDNSNSINFYIYTSQLKHFVTYHTLVPLDIHRGWVTLEGFPITENDRRNIAVNVVGGPSQIMAPPNTPELDASNYDYDIQYGSVVWKNMAMEPFVAAGDILRIVFSGYLQQRALETLILHGRYSNYEPESAIFVSPSGSDSTVLGGDGTNTGGNGTLELPYRTVDKALSVSEDGDNIVMFAGEYPLFQGIDNRVLVPVTDRTAVNDFYNRRCLMDLFDPKDFRAYGTTLYDTVPWDFTYAGKSYVASGGGFLSFTYDGTNTARADSSFGLVNDLEVQAEIRSAVDPLRFMVTSADNTMMFSYCDSSYVATVTTGGITYNCRGLLDGTYEPRMVIDYIPVTSTDIDNQYVSLSHVPEPSQTVQVAVNVVGGVAQELGEDFYIEDSKIKWDGMENLPELDPGEVLRVMYLDRSMIPVKVYMSLIGKRFTLKTYVGGKWHILNKRDMVGDYHGPWRVSFVMDTPTPGENHDVIYGKGFVSQFFAVGESFTDTDMDRPLTVNTERKNVILYKNRWPEWPGTGYAPLT